MVDVMSDWYFSELAGLDTGWSRLSQSKSDIASGSQSTAPHQVSHFILIFGQVLEVLQHDATLQQREIHRWVWPGVAKRTSVTGILFPGKLRLSKIFPSFYQNIVHRILCLSSVIGDDAVSRATVNSSADSGGNGFQEDFQPLNIPSLEDHLASAEDTWTLSPDEGGQPLHPETDYFLNSSTKSSAASSASEFQGDFQPLDIPYFEDHLATVQNTWTLSPHQGGQPSVQETEYFNSNSTGLEGVDGGPAS